MEKTYIQSSVLQDVAEVLSGKWTRTLHVRSLIHDLEYWIWDEELEKFDVDYLDDEESLGLALLGMQPSSSETASIALRSAIDTGDVQTARAIATNSANYNRKVREAINKRRLAVIEKWSEEYNG